MPYVCVYTVKSKTAIVNTQITIVSRIAKEGIVKSDAGTSSSAVAADGMVIRHVCGMFVE